MKIIIDTDPGVDDALALFYAKTSSAFEIVGFTSVFGNVTTDTATENTLWLSEQLGFDAPVAGGVQQPLGNVKHEPHPIIHGEFGFGTHEQRQPKNVPVDHDAADFLIEQAANAPGEITVVALGPLANIAEALNRDPAFAENVHEIVIMGGAYNAPGNVTEYAEANIHNDPYSAEVVFSKAKKIRAIGLDITDQILFSRNDLSNMINHAGSWAPFVKNCCEYYLDFYASQGVTTGAGLHDPVTLIYLVRPELFEFKTGSVNVVLEGDTRGLTQFTAGNGNMEYAASAKNDAVLQEFLKSLQSLANS